MYRYYILIVYFYIYVRLFKYSIAYNTIICKIFIYYTIYDVIICNIQHIYIRKI